MFLVPLFRRSDCQEHGLAIPERLHEALEITSRYVSKSGLLRSQIVLFIFVSVPFWCENARFNAHVRYLTKFLAATKKCNEKSSRKNKLLVQFDQNRPMDSFHYKLPIVPVADYFGGHVFSTVHAVVVPDAKLKLGEMLCEKR